MLKNVFFRQVKSSTLIKQFWKSFPTRQVSLKTDFIQESYPPTSTCHSHWDFFATNEAFKACDVPLQSLIHGSQIVGGVLPCTAWLCGDNWAKDWAFSLPSWLWKHAHFGGVVCMSTHKACVAFKTCIMVWGCHTLVALCMGNVYIENMMAWLEATILAHTTT
jgi:hypothetical protein